MDTTLIYTFLFLYAAVIILAFQIHELRKQINKKDFPTKDVITSEPVKWKSKFKHGMTPQQIDEPAPFFTHDTDRP